MGVLDRLVDRAVSESAALRQVWGSFALALLAAAIIVGAVIWNALGWRYESIIAIKDSTISRLECELRSWLEAIKPSSDPEAIYQLGEKRGRAIGMEMRMSERAVYFKHIDADGDFSRSDEFDYRDMRLVIVAAGSTATQSSMGIMRAQVISDVKAKILAKAH